MSELLQWDDHMIKVKSENYFCAPLPYSPFFISYSVREAKLTF